MRRTSTPSPHQRAGFTLMEAMLATAVLAFVVAALTQAIVAGQMQTYDALHANRATALAEAMMEEVLSLPYADPEGALTIGPDTGETDRSSFDNIDDYHNHFEDVDAVADLAGNLYGDLFQGFTRTVTVADDNVNVPAFSASRSGVTVVVTVQEGTSGRTWTVTRFVPEPTS